MDSSCGDPQQRGTGFPIRIPTDHSLLAAPRGVSPLAASFIGTLPQGIHHAPLLGFSLSYSGWQNPDNARRAVGLHTQRTYFPSAVFKAQSSERSQFLVPSSWSLPHLNPRAKAPAQNLLCNRAPLRDAPHRTGFIPVVDAGRLERPTCCVQSSCSPS